MSQRGFCTIKEKSDPQSKQGATMAKKNFLVERNLAQTQILEGCHLPMTSSGEKEIRKYKKWRERERERESGRQARVS